MGGYEIAGPSGPPSELERYLFEAAGVADAARVLPRDRVGRRARLHRALLRDLRRAAVRADAISRCSTTATSRISTRSSTTCDVVYVAGREHREHARPCGARTASTARSRERGRGARLRGRRRERGRDVLVRRGLHDVVRPARRRCTTASAGSPAASARTRSNPAGSTRTRRASRDGSLPPGWARRRRRRAALRRRPCSSA